MAQRYFNWKLAIVLVVAIAVFTAAAYALHQWQKSTRAEQALPEGEQAYAEQNWQEAATKFGRYLVAHSDDVAVLLKYADAQLKIRPMQSGNLMQAVTAYRSVLRLDKANGEAAERLVGLYLQAMGRPDEAEQVARQYLEGHDDPALQRMLAIALIQQRKFEEAEQLITGLVAKHPAEILAYEVMGRFAAERPDDVEKPASYWCEEMVKNNPDSALAYAARAGFYLRANKPALAKADLEQAEKRDLSDVDVHLRLVSELIRVGDFDKARAHLTALEKEASDRLVLWQYWAEVALRSGSVDQMQGVAERGLKAMAAQPLDFTPSAAELFIRAGQVEKAKQCLLQMRKRDMLPATAAFLEGMLADQQGLLGDAVARWQEAVVLGYKSAQVHMVLASAFSRLGDIQSAIGQLRILVSEDPGGLNGRLALAQLLVKTRAWSEVQEQARQVLQVDPNHMGAKLLNLQARTNVLKANSASGTDQTAAWQDLEGQLAELDKGTGGALQVKLLEVQVAMMQEKFSEAAALLETVRNEPGAEVSVALLDAELAAVQGKEDAAIQVLRDAVERSPQALDPVRTLALLYNRKGMQKECETVIKEAIVRIEPAPVRLDLGLLLADLYTQWGQKENLYAWLTDLAGKFPGDVQTKRRLLACDAVSQDTEAAQKLVDEMKVLEGEKGWQWRYEQARVWINASSFRDHYGDVVRSLQENLLANPQDQASRLLLAVAHEKAGELQLALAVYREALNRSPENVQIVIRMVVVLYGLEEFDEAQQILDKAAQQKLDHPDLQKLRLQGDLRAGSLGSASDILRDLVKKDPNDIASGLSLASLLIRDGKFSEAQTILTDLKAKAPDSISVTAAQIQLDIQQGDAAAAIGLADGVVKKLNNAYAYTLRAQTYVLLKQANLALEDFNRAVSMEPDQADFWAARSGFYQSIGQVQEAIQDIRKALALLPDSLTLQRRAVSLLLASGDAANRRQAEALLGRALSANPNDTQLGLLDAQVKLLKAEELLAKGTRPGVEEAQSLLRKLTVDRPKIAQAWGLLGRLELDLGQPGKAMDTALQGLAHSPDDKQLLLLKARAEARRSPGLAVPTLRGLAENSPNDVDIIVELAGAYVNSGNPTNAIDLLRERLETFEGPARRRCELALATVLYRSGDKDGAKTLFDMLIQAEPDNALHILTLAQLFSGEKRWTDAEQLATQWRQKHPDDANITMVIASVLIETGDPEARQTAEKMLQALLGRHPESTGTLELLAMLMQSTGRSEEFTALNRRMLEIDPNNVKAMNNLAWDLSEEQGQYQEALVLADKGLAMAPEYGDLIDTRGMIHYHLGHLEDAARDFRRSLELFMPNAPAVVATRFHLAQTYADMGRKTQAVEQVKQGGEQLKQNMDLLVARLDAGIGRNLEKVVEIKQVRDVLRQALDLLLARAGAEIGRGTQLTKQLEQVLDLYNRARTGSPDSLKDAQRLLEQLQKGS